MLSWIAGDFFQQSPMLFYPILSLAIFMTVFCVASLKLAFFANTAHIEKLASLPFEEDAHHE